MIEVKHLTKRYGKHTAVDDISFTVQDGCIYGLLGPNGSYKLSILKAADGTGRRCLRQTFEYPGQPGLGHFIHTYKCDGDPIPSYEGEPTPVSIEGDIDAFTASLWENLNQDNKVSLFVRTIDLATGATDTRIVNKNQ